MATETPITSLLPSSQEISILAGKSIPYFADSDGAAGAIDGDTVKACLEKANSAYQKPGTGVPKTDLASDVQTSLGKADSAVQDISGKADKVTSATEGNIAMLDENGNLQDGGVSLFGLSDGVRHPAPAEGIADTISAGTSQQFVYRKSAGDGVNYMKKIYGKSLAWNQRIVDTMVLGNSTNQWNTFDASTTLSLSDNIITMTKSGGYGILRYNLSNSTIIGGHKYYMSAIIKTAAPANSVAISAYAVDTIIDVSRVNNIASSGWQQICAIKGCSSPDSQEVRITNAEASDYHSVQVKSCMFIDLTLMFGAGHEPSTVAEFEAMFPNAYYPYTAGELISNDAEAIETVGFNQWDEQWEVGGIGGGEPFPDNSQIRSATFTPVIPGSTLYFKTPNSLFIFWYDSNQQYIDSYSQVSNADTLTVPSNAAYFKLTDRTRSTYAYDICINLSDTDKNGTYEPYWKRTMALNLDSFQVKDSLGNITTITGGLKSAGSVRDEIVGNKFVQKVGSRAYQSGDDSDSSVITDGTNTYYALATPVEYELFVPVPNAIMVDEGGTERMIQPTHTSGAPSAPFNCASNYSISIKRLISALNSLNE